MTLFESIGNIIMRIIAHLQPYLKMFEQNYKIFTFGEDSNDNAYKDKENIFIKAWNGFMATVDNLMKGNKKKSASDLIKERRAKEYGFSSSPVDFIQIIQNFFRAFGRPIMILGLIGGSIIINFLAQKKYLNDLMEQKMTLSSSILLNSSAYKNINFNPPYPYFYNEYTKQNDILYLRDYFFPCSFKSYNVGSYGSKPSIDQIKAIIDAGARVLHFDVYEDLINHNIYSEDSDEIIDSKSNYIPMVRDSVNKVEEGITFKDAIDALYNAEPFNGNNIYNPLILYLDFWYQDDEAYPLIYDSSKKKIIINENPENGQKNQIGTSTKHKGFRKNTSTYLQILEIIKNSKFGEKNKDGSYKIFGVKEGTTSSTYGSCGTKHNSNFSDIPMLYAMGRLLLISNVGLNPCNNNSIGDLAKYLYTTVYTQDIENPTINGDNEYYQYNNDYIIDCKVDQGLTGDALSQKLICKIYGNNMASSSGIIGVNGDIGEIVNTHRTSISMYIPQVENLDSDTNWQTNINNPNFMDCYQYGIQMVFMNYQNCFDQIPEYIQFFSNKQFIVKSGNQNKDQSRCLRFILHPNTTTGQNPDLSYADRKVLLTCPNSRGEPMYDYNT